MQNAITPFQFESESLRSIKDEQGEPWFVLADVCRMLELSNPSAVKSRIDKADVQVIDLASGIFTLSNKEGRKATNVVNESGLYSCIFQGRTDQAKKFKRWVTSEVLPSIRKTGKYAVAMTASEIILLQAQQLVELERKQVEQAEQLKRLEAKQEAFEKGINDFSIVAYCGYKGYPAVNMEQAQRLGKAAAKLCRESGLPIGKVRDPRFGYVNTYPETVLEEVFAGELEF